MRESGEVLQLSRFLRYEIHTWVVVARMVFVYTVSFVLH